jgi:hypothetical protein
METKSTIDVSQSAPQGGRGLGSHVFVDTFALLYHLTVAERLREHPERIVSHARENLRRWMAENGMGGGERLTLEEWQGILNSSSIERLVEIITEESDEGQRLRSSSPFVGVLTPQERLEILEACEHGATA